MSGAGGGSAARARLRASAGRRGGWLLAAALLASPLGAQAVARRGCDLCHGELELLRRRGTSLDDARRLHVPADRLLRSAHAGLDCAACHSGFARFPHPEQGRATGACASCHEDVERAWTEDVHAAEGSATCESCHGVHDVPRPEALRTGAGIRTMNERCTTCHLEAGYTAGDVHADTVACASCHGSHGMRAAGDPGSSVAAARQASTCGACHEDVAEGWREDVHGSAMAERSGAAPPEDALRPGGDTAAREGEAHEPPTCSTCHRAHPVRETGTDAFALAVPGTCAACHERYQESFADSYHGQASRLGAGAVATCASCHTAHRVFPEEDPRSSVNDARVLETCRSCHPDAGAGFAGFQPHADHGDRARYPHVYWTYRLMSGLLLAVFAAFGLHTALWLARLAADARRDRSRPVGGRAAP